MVHKLIFLCKIKVGNALRTALELRRKQSKLSAIVVSAWLSNSSYKFHVRQTMASDAQPSSKQRNIHRSHRPTSPCSPNADKEKIDQNSSLPVQCVVCGDRACSHHYYGVAACHGCKCFFWRSVKANASYVCRYEGNCAIDVNGRNACRHCRFNRCLQAGMKPEAVRMERQPLTSEQKKSKLKRIARGNNISLDFVEKDADGEQMETNENIDTVASKKLRFENRALMNSLVQTDRLVSEGVSLARKGKAALCLRDAFVEPSKLDADRTPIAYTQKEVSDLSVIEKCRRRTLVAAVDWIRLIDNFDDLLSPEDKVSLLRSCYASLTVFELCSRTAQTTVNPTMLCLPTGFSLSKDKKLLSCSFLNSKIIANMLEMLTKPLSFLELDEKEIAMIKAVIVLNPDAPGLSATTAQAVSGLRDRVHSALYQYCGDQYLSTVAAIRFAKLLHLLPKIATLATQLEEHIQVTHTFSTESSSDPLLKELLGDIFEECASIAPASPNSIGDLAAEKNLSSTTAAFLDPDDNS